MASKEAMELAGRYEWSVAAVEKLAADIDTALAQARLEGAKAMQGVCAECAWPCPEDYKPSMPSEHAASNIAKYISALDTQQVINERMGK